MVKQTMTYDFFHIFHNLEIVSIMVKNVIGVVTHVVFCIWVVIFGSNKLARLYKFRDDAPRFYDGLTDDSISFW